MPDERERRKPGFLEGVDVRLADGHLWTLPIRETPRDDPEFDALLKAMAEAEDRAERFRLELALTILLLSRNYDLSSNQIRSLLDFSQGDPALLELQDDLRRLSVRMSTLSSLRTSGAGLTASRHARTRSGNSSPATNTY